MITWAIGYVEASTLRIEITVGIFVANSDRIIIILFKYHASRSWQRIWIDLTDPGSIIVSIQSIKKPKVIYTIQKRPYLQ